MSGPLKDRVLGENSFSPGKSNIASHTSDVSKPVNRRVERWRLALVCILLPLAVWAVFGQTIHFHQFVNYDTDIYVYENRDITEGLSVAGIIWAFTHLHVDEWWPLNAISHMLDCELYGLDAGGHHLTNVLLHMASVVLLFLVLRSITGAFWRSAFVAALFAVHPLRVESVAWITERKDVLSGLFFVLTLAAYVRYVRRPFTFRRYLLVLMVFALGLLSKSMLVTMPFLLLLLDWWPLRRIEFGNDRRPFEVSLFKRLILEKVPLALMAVGGSLATMFAVKDLHAIDELSFPWRVGNALVSYGTYIWQMIYPVNLAVFYPHPEKNLALSAVGLSLLVLALISAGAIATWRKQPYLLMGWLWYLGMLVPVIGFVQVGIQARADRYTYLPQIGLYVLIAWGVWELCGSWRHRRTVLSVAAVAVLVALIMVARVQTTYWRDSESLWTHAVACTTANPMAHHYLGNVFMSQGKVNEAIAQYEQAIRFKPNYVRALNNLGVALSSQGRSAEAVPLFRRVVERRPNYANAQFNLGVALADQSMLAEAIQHFERALRLKPGAADVHHNLALTLFALGKLPEAIRHFERAIELKPDYAEAHHKLGSTLVAAGNLPEAIRHYRRALALRPGYARTYYKLGNALAASGKWDEARQHYEQALQINPDNPDACNNLGNALATLGRLDEAVPYFERTIELNPGIAEAHGNLASALAAQGKREAARQHLEIALELATAQTNAALAEAIQTRLSTFQMQPGEQ